MKVQIGKVKGHVAIQFDLDGSVLAGDGGKPGTLNKQQSFLFFSNDPSFRRT